MSSKVLNKFSEELSEDEAKSEDLAKDPERQQKSTPGVGTDIFIRKKKPGSQVGKGYFVDIYENGVKIDTIELATKKNVTKLIRKFKDKYNTDRAFQNEMQVHITYKTKKERGEQPMASIDTILVKKAHKIQEILNRLTEPELPLVKRFAQEELLENVNSVPETPPTGTEDKENIKRYIADEVNKKYTEFVNEKVNSGYGALDDIYNPLRKWYENLSDKIQEWNNMSNNMLNDNDVKDIITQTEKIILSQDAELIQKNTGIPISPETATLMYDVGSKSVGKPGEAEKGGELGGNPEDFKEETQMKAAKSSENKATIESTNDLLASFTKHIQTQGNTMAITDIAKDLNVIDDEILQKMHSILSEKDELVEAEAAIKKYIEDQLEMEKKSSLHPSIIESKATDFWKFAGEYKGIANIEDVFIDWIKKTNCDLKQANNIWKKVNGDIVEAFGFDREKQAGEKYSIGDIFYMVENEILFSGYLEYDQTRKRIVLNPYQDPQGIGYETLAPLVPDFEHSKPLENIEDAIEEVPGVLTRFMDLNYVKPMARALLATKSEPTNLQIRVEQRSEMGGQPFKLGEYTYTVSPYGEDVAL
jgi:hypothetical protein